MFGKALVMIVILYETGVEKTARTIQEMLEESYRDQVHIQLLQAESTLGWPREPSWDDLMIVPFEKEPFCSKSREFLQSVLRGRNGSLPTIPVALSSEHPTPPDPIAHIKALPLYNHHRDSFDPLLRRAGALLGLTLRAREQVIFISYRASDGTILAEQLEDFLRCSGYRVWRDESRDEFDGETSILPGVDVQRAIQDNLSRANLVLLLDTPHAVESRWIKLEVDFANGELIPIFPVLILAPGERYRTSRFRSLATLQRGCEFAASPQSSYASLENAELDQILNEVETYLRDIFQRKLRLPFQVEREFVKHGYTWSKRDQFIYEALRSQNRVLRMRIFSHCSYFDGIYDPALLAFVRHLETARPRANFALYIYDGAPIPSPQLEDIRRKANLDQSTDILTLSHGEIATFHSNFRNTNL
jgi:hypothetical protein